MMQGYLLSNEAMKRGKETGYVKFTDMAMKFFNLIEEIRNLDGGKTVYIMLHEELDDVGNAKLKLTGKMLDQQVCIRAVSQQHLGVCVVMANIF